MREYNFPVNQFTSNTRIRSVKNIKKWLPLVVSSGFLVLAPVSALASAAGYLAPEAVGIGFVNFGAHIGGLNSSIPGGQLFASQEVVHRGYLKERVFYGSNASIPGAVFEGSLKYGYLDRLSPNSYVMPYLDVGHVAIIPSADPQRISAWYGAGGISYNRVLYHAVKLSISGGVGRDFATHITDLNANTIGGLFYTAKADISAPMGDGPAGSKGFLTLFVEYQKMPFGDHLSLSTDQFGIGYSLNF